MGTKKIPDESGKGFYQISETGLLYLIYKKIKLIPLILSIISLLQSIIVVLLSMQIW